MRHVKAGRRPARRFDHQSGFRVRVIAGAEVSGRTAAHQARSATIGRKCEGGPGRRFHTIAEMEAGMRRLVVADVLPRDAQAILRVVHERAQAVLRRNRRGVEAQLLVVRGAQVGGGEAQAAARGLAEADLLHPIQ